MKKRIRAIELLLISLSVMAFFSACGTSSTAPVVTINGTELIVGESTIADLESGGVIINDSYSQTLNGRSWSSEIYEIGRKRSELTEQELSLIDADSELFETTIPYGYAYLYNSNLTKTDIADCRIYKYIYNAAPGMTDGLPILLNGDEISRRATVEDVKKIMKDIKIDSDSEGEYEYIHTLTYKDGNYSYYFHFDINNNDYADPDKLYLNELRIEVKIKKKY